MSVLQESICESIYSTIEALCPGLYVERSPLSVSHLAQAVSTPHAYKPRDVLLAQLAGTTSLLADAVNHPETFADLISFGDTEVTDCCLLVRPKAIACGADLSFTPCLLYTSDAADE